MSQYRLTKPKKSRSKFSFLLTAVLVVAVLAVVAFIFLAKNKTPIAISLPVVPAEPTSSLDFMRKKFGSCTNAARDQFVKDASRINGAFEDSFALASGTSRIALSPIVANMQSAAREMKALTVDDCGKLVQEKLAAAYDEAVAMFLAFMKESSAGTGLIEVGTQLQAAYRFLLAYQMDASAPFLLQDFFAWSRNENNKLPQPPELTYLSEIEGKRARCDDYEMVERLSFSYYEASIHYGTSDVLRDMAKEAMRAPTPELCNGHIWLDTPRTDK